MMVKTRYQRKLQLIHKGEKRIHSNASEDIEINDEEKKE